MKLLPVTSDRPRQSLVGWGLGAIAVLALLATLEWPSLAALEHVMRGHHAGLLAWHGEHPLEVLCAFCLVFTLMSALAIPGCSVLAIGAGAVFGLPAGAVLVSLSSAIGASLSFALARRFAREPLRRRFGARMDAIDAGLQRDGALYLFSLRMAPVVPYALLNPLMGLTSMPAWTFFWVSAVGMLAGSAMYAAAGAGLGQWAGGGLPSMAVLASFSLMAALPWAWRWHRLRGERAR
jgi:uncharacterized membrane protein YdjX (TVP38/TMEM64 family)